MPASGAASWRMLRGGIGQGHDGRLKSGASGSTASSRARSASLVALDVIGIEQTEESALAACRRGGAYGGRLQRGAGRFLLKPHAGQIAAEAADALRPDAELRPEDLRGVGREAQCALEAAMRHPGIAAGLRHVLPAHDHRPEARILADRVVDVLRGVGFVREHEAACAKSQILDQDRVALRLGGAAVFQLDTPEPERFSRMQPQRHPVMDTGGLALPDEAVRRAADLQLRLRPRDLDRRAVRSRGAAAPARCRCRAASRTPD